MSPSGSLERSSETSPRIVGRYALFDAIASGGMASVHFGRLIGPVGFSRTVAIKRLHESFSTDPEFVAMFLDEARVAARIRHPNVVPTLDVVALEHELLLVMEYVSGESLSALLQSARLAKRPNPIAIVVDVMVQALHGLHAAHEATDESGAALGIVHRDVSPQNILVGTDGVARVLDFGVAKAIGRMHQTREGQIKGKIRYMAPEQIVGKSVNRTADVYAAAVVLWEALTGERLFKGDNDAEVMYRVIQGRSEPPSRVRPDIPPALDALVLRGLQAVASDRFATAEQFAVALEAVVPPVSRSAAAAWVQESARESIGRRNERLAAVESSGMRATVRLPNEVSTVSDAPSSTSAVMTSTECVVDAPASSPARSWRGRRAIAGAIAAALLAATLPLFLSSGAPTLLTASSFEVFLPQLVEPVVAVPQPPITPAVIVVDDVPPAAANAIAAPVIPARPPPSPVIRRAPPPAAGGKAKLPASDRLYRRD